MKTIGMNKVDKQALVEIACGAEMQVDFPNKVVVLDFEGGTIDQGEQGKMAWAKLIVGSAEELRKLKSVGLEENVNELTLKLAKYNGENLNDLVGKTISTDSADIVPLEKRSPRGTDIVGLAFKMELGQVKVVG